MEYKELLHTLEKRFEKNKHRHQNTSWETVTKLLNDSLLQSLQKMEETGGEPDVIALNDGLFYVDMSKESPKNRRSLCYDKEARVKRKKFPPESSALELASDLNVDILNEAMYFEIQEIEPLDLKTSSWIHTEDRLRTLGGALFATNRYQRVFVYHNGADSYYKDRGFRGYLTLKQ